ncbi:mandelate racemase/muconate lactonizing enzyme family protein [Nocardioides kongjuensis]|uniref:Mandelate racemase/muconate lactonizing enzyme family protein n=2 Tax=Nocardioides TaxID=1839 RepID=A0A5C4W114_9ACTN|nr:MULTISPECIES: mandelate racemase/muconate lactonizing enzyme family protein [Nocardioides]NYD32005.1 L-alanine-DL-glutamate epimerase-like enolase superfamily enzyme [Nocardioides kongjuensis]TNM41934.1 mandelate racemase/muconate lactonizing enzyme family protein [Nocardioides albidus]
MRITAVKIVRLDTGAGEFGIAWSPTVLRVETDEGIHGVGEIGLPMGNAAHGQVGLARDFCALVLGMDPFDTTAVWERLYRSTFWGMGGGTLIFAVMSAIDIALWDIKGKALDVPVHRLLGGQTNTRLRSYASQIQFDWSPRMGAMVKPEEYAEATRKALADGFDCVKVNPIGFDLAGTWMGWNTRGVLTAEQVRTAVDRIAAVREAGGDDLDIIIELHCHTDAGTAVQLGRELERFRILYYEEPTAPLNWKAMAKVKRELSIPIATGERLYTAFGFRPFIENQVVDIAQPDLGTSGGFTETKKIADMAAVYDIGVQLHLIGSPISTAAALQLEAVLANFVIHEHNNTSLMPDNVASCLYDYQPVDGYYAVPDLPGIGQDLTPEAYAKSETLLVN